MQPQRERCGSLAPTVRQLEIESGRRIQMKRLASYLFVFFTLSLNVTSCKKEQTLETRQEPFSGIMETNVNCVVIGGGTTDFLPRPTRSGQFPNLPTNYSLVKACPNPVLGDTTFIEFQIPVADSVWLQVFATTNAPPIATILSERLPLGYFRFRWGFNGPNGVYRVWMYAGNGFTAYGDVEFR